MYCIVLFLPFLINKIRLISEAYLSNQLKNKTHPQRNPKALIISHIFIEQININKNNICIFLSFVMPENMLFL